MKWTLQCLRKGSGKARWHNVIKGTETQVKHFGSDAARGAKNREYRIVTPQGKRLDWFMTGGIKVDPHGHNHEMEMGWVEVVRKKLSPAPVTK